ncbi:MAG: TolC family protein [Desulfuromonadales bacterium]|nr:TolC family protein [Desulfuromonadales bacterium]
MLRTTIPVTFLLALLLAGPVMATDLAEAGQILPLQEVLFRGLEVNFDLQAQRLNLPISREEITVEAARFDLMAHAAVSAAGERTPTAASSFTDPYDRRRQSGATIGLGKEFHSGLDARLSLEGSRLSNNAVTPGLDPEYRTYLLLDFTQPLLRDFGRAVNTTNLRLADQRLQQARFGYLDQAQRLAEELELSYFELARSHEILRLRIESRELARELLAGNRDKFEAGIVPITEVQEAETAAAARDEQVVVARQQMEIAANRLKKLLEIGHNDPLAAVLLQTEPLPGIEQVWPPLETALQTALVARPDLERQRLEIASRDLRLAYFQNQKLPRLDLAASLGVNGLSGDAEDPATPGALANRGDSWRSLDQAASGDGYAWFAGLRFAYPLENRAAAANYRRAGHEKRQALYTLKGLESTVETEVRNALTAVERGFERVQVAERFQQLADITLSQEMERLSEGLTDTFRILDFQAVVIEARVRKANALIDFNAGLSRLYRAMGANLERRNIVHPLEDKEIQNVRN